MEIEKITDWEEVKGETSVWIPKLGEEIQGVIISMTQGNYGIQTVIEDKDHKQIILPSHKVLQSRLSNCKVGDLIKVIYEKEELPKIKGQHGTKIYKVLTKKLI